MNPHLLIAGHGYLGQEISRQASGTGWQVTSLSKSGGPGALACDLSNPAQVEALQSEIRPSSIIFSASSGRGGTEAYRAVFLQGTRNLLSTFPEAHLLFVSSTSVYHQVDGTLVTEESPTQPTRETGEILRGGWPASQTITTSSRSHIPASDIRHLRRAFPSRNSQRTSCPVPFPVAVERKHLHLQLVTIFQPHRVSLRSRHYSDHPW